MQPKRKSLIAVLCMITFLIITVFFISLNVGVIRISPMETIQTLFGFGTEENKLVLFEFRLPRMILAICIGAGLAVSGAILQSITRNELAEPGIVGINAGASLAVVMFIFLTGGTMETLSEFSIFVLPFIAFIGAIMAAFLIYIFAWKNGVTPMRLILVGIAINAIFSALLIVIQLGMENRDFMKALVWISGSIWTANWKYVVAILPWILILIPFTIYKSRYLNILQLGDNLSIGLGLDVEKERRKLILLSVALAGSSVAVGGGITFLGLVAPHIARKIVGPQHERFILTSALLGSLILLFADMIGRVIIMPSELPVGIVVSCLGAPYFLYLLMKN
jgi:iron complex transport system permease protein